nr:uncharacterized protein LOC123769800 [Procambarus clarkii]
MHISWFVGVALMVVAVTEALPLTVDAYNSEKASTGSKTLEAVKEFFNPMTDYLHKLPSKTPAKVATEIKEKVTNMKQWVEETKAVKDLTSSLAPVKAWLKEKTAIMHEKATALQHTTFQQMHDHMKEQVTSLDHKIATWIKEHIPKH